MMGARGHAGVHNDVVAYTQSTAIDRRMLLHDIWGSKAHVLMLGAQRILDDDDVRQILAGLVRIETEARSGSFRLDPALEDVHMNVETALAQDIGRPYAGKLHTARSRNDQVITDARLYVREELLGIQDATVDLIRVFLGLADAHIATVMPGYTHTQHAQPITLAYWASAHATLLSEDLRRLAAAFQTTDQNPLGACALAGTSFPTDRHLTAKLLGFASVQHHALATVSGRDFVLETAFALSMLMTNLSRMAEEIILWSSYEFGYLVLDDAYALGSSIMPQKKNPTVAELARGRTGAVHGRLMQLLTMMKGLPLGYHSDLQEDKPPLWDALDTVAATLNIMGPMIRTSSVREDRMLDATYGSFSTATELANFLVQERQTSFRDAHELVGRLVSELVDEGLTFRAIERCQQLLNARGLGISQEALSYIFDPAEAVRRATSLGATSPGSVAPIIAELRRSSDKHRDAIQRHQQHIDAAREYTADIAQRVQDGTTVAQAIAHTAP